MNLIRNPITVLAVWLALVFSLAQAQPGGTGIITGRILNEGTGQYLRNATVTVVGTNISTVAESGGAYTLSGVPAGQARVAVSFVGLDPAEAIVTVTPGQTVVQDFTMSNKANAAIVKLDAYHVATEREGNFKAMQEQKSALEIKSIVSSDAFGEVSEGNVGEFLKMMPGVMVDFVNADVRAVSIGGLDPKYSVIMMDGAPVASAGSSNIGTGRTFEFEQLSISSIESAELSKTPTPDVPGSALAGVVNLRSKGAFDRKGRQIRWSASSQFNSHQMTLKETAGPADKKTYKFQPNLSLEFSDVILDGKLGVLAGYNFSRTFVEQNTTNYTYVVNANAADNATEIPRLSQLRLTDTPKVTTRTNYNVRLDYKFSPELMVWVRGDLNDYEALNYQRNVTFDLANAVNGPGANDPAEAGAEYSLKSQTTTAGVSILSRNLTFNKHGATTTLASGAAFKRGAFRADVQAQVSIATNYYQDIENGFFNAGSTGNSRAFRLRWDRASGGDPGINVTQLSGADWRNPANYTAAPSPTARQPFNSKDQKWTAKADFRYDWRRWTVPLFLKWGGDISQSIRNVDQGQILAHPYLGPDGIAGTGDERWAVEPYYQMRNLAGGNLQGIPVIDHFAMAREFRAHPERFVLPTPQQVLMSALTTHWDVKEQIDSLYQQTIIKVTKKFDLAPGVRLEKTRSAGRGPTDRGDDYAKQKLTGNPNANIPTTSLDYIQARYGQDVTNTSDSHTWLKYLHATYRWSNELILRASFNDSITRPDLNNLAGGLTINPDALPFPTANIPNPALQPEHGRNIFTSAEYYFPKRAGSFSVTAARRDISQLIRSNTVDVPIGGTFPNQQGYDLGGHRVTTVNNVAKSHLTTFEFSYRQNMVFLPGFWQRFSIFGNYTALKYDDYDNFRRPTNIANGGVSFDHQGISLRWNVTWLPIFRRVAVPANGWNIMEGTRLNHDAQFSYRVTKTISVFVTARNIFNDKPRNYWGHMRNDILSQQQDHGGIWNVGVRGQF